MSRTSAVRSDSEPEALELAVLDRAQDLALSRQAEVGDLVEEQRPSVGELEFPLHPLIGAGERAPLVAEQLAVEQRLAQRRGVERDERLRLARRRVVDRAREERLAGA